MIWSHPWILCNFSVTSKPNQWLHLNYKQNWTRSYKPYGTILLCLIKKSNNKKKNPSISLPGFYFCNQVGLLGPKLDEHLFNPYKSQETTIRGKMGSQLYEYSETIHFYLSQTNDYMNLLYQFCSIQFKSNKEQIFHQSTNKASN